MTTTINEANYGKLLADFDIDATYDNKSKLYEIDHTFCKSRPISYTDYKYNKSGCDCTLALKTYEWNYLYEGLVTSASIEQTYNRLNKYNGLIRGLASEGSPFNKTQYLSFYMPIAYYINDNPEDEDYEEVKQLKISLYKDIENLGWFIAVDKICAQSNDYQYIAIHPKFIVDVTDEIYKSNGILYHLTQSKNMKKINKTGLIPRNSNTYESYPDRVYLYNTTNPNTLDAHIKEHMTKFKLSKKQFLDKAISDYESGILSRTTLQHIADNRYDYREFTILKIDLKNKRHYDENDITTHYKFYDDPKSSGVFTYENIDPLCISVYKEIAVPDTDDFDYILQYLK